MELDWIIFSSIQSQQHDCRFGCGHPPTPAAHSAVGLHGVRHRRHRTRHRPFLYSEEKMSNPKFNRTGDPKLEYLSKFTVSGLWTLCYTSRTFRLNDF